MLFLNLHDQAILPAMMLWGVWLFPLAILVYRSRFIPRFLAALLAINGLAWMVLSLVGILVPRDMDMVYRITAPARFGEIATMLWLLVMGAKERTVSAPAS